MKTRIKLLSRSASRRRHGIVAPHYRKRTGSISVWMSALTLFSALSVTAGTFSRPVPDVYPGTPFVSCLIGNFEEPSRSHKWQLRYRGTGIHNVGLTIVATTINTSETGAIQATVTDANGQQTIVVPHPPHQGDNVQTLPLTLQGGQTYHLTLERIAPVQGPGARHYKIGANDKRLEIGFEDLRYLEHENQTFVVNADAPEDVKILLFADPLPGATAPQASSITASIKDGACNVIVPSRAYSLPAQLSVPAHPGGTLIVHIEHADGHFRIRKDSGSDRAIYLLPCPPPPQIVCPPNMVVHTRGNDCGAQVTFNVTASGSCGPLPVTSTPPSGSFFPVGTHIVWSEAREGHHTARCAFTVTVLDKQPPQIFCPPNRVLSNEPGQCGAIVKFRPPAFDNCGPVEVKCEPPSGSFFPVGPTTVVCTATDKSGNQATCSFTITIQDKEPPIADCTPTTNPSGQHVPNAGDNPRSGQNPDGFYELSGSDNCDAPNAIGIYIRDSASDFMAGPFRAGDKVKITQAPGVTPNQKPMAGVVVAHIQLKGDALVYGVDSSGNASAPHACLVPPRPK